MAKKTARSPAPAAAKTTRRKSVKSAGAAETKKRQSAKSSAKSGPVANSVRVRMYCQGLGDCFLITLPRSGRSAGQFHILIDCGVILGTPSPTDLIRPAVEDILAETKGTVDLLIATHEHWDHLSGFVQARELFDKLKFREVWLGWTEDPNDPVAKELIAERAKKLEMAKKAIKLAAFHMGAADSDIKSAVEVLSFFGIDSDSDDSGLGVAGKGKSKGGSGTTGEAMEWLRAKSPKFLKPGSHLELDGVDGVRAYVLGPPTDLKKLRKDMPTKAGKEVYELSPYDAAQFGALGNYSPEWSEGYDPYLPFDDQYKVPPAQVEIDPFFATTYLTPSDDWRRIDGEWLSGIAQFALQLDSDTNNTSLALAFELPDGRVLLFPGDAQVGNWESWHDYAWEIDNQKVVATDILARTVLYKVGHHGSHNATLREKGLELMTNANLVALLPVDEYIAHEKKRWTKMPFQPLLNRLAEKTAKRILRPDKSPEDSSADQSFAAQVQYARTTIEPEVAEGHTAKRPLYVDYTIPFKAARNSGKK